MTKKNLLLTSLTVSLVFTAVASGLVVNSYAQTSSQNISSNSSNLSQIEKIRTKFGRKGYKEDINKISKVNKVAISEAIKNKDYDAWKTAIVSSSNGDYLLSKINKENFDKYIEMLNALKTIKDGETVEESLTKIDEMRKDLSLPTSDETKITKKSIKIAIENKDYDAFKKALAGTPLEKESLQRVDTQEKFNAMADKMNQRQKYSAGFFGDGLGNSKGMLKI